MVRAPVTFKTSERAKNENLLFIRRRQIHRTLLQVHERRFRRTSRRRRLRRGERTPPPSPHRVDISHRERLRRRQTIQTRRRIRPFATGMAKRHALRRRRRLHPARLLRLRLRLPLARENPKPVLHPNQNSRIRASSENAHGRWISRHLRGRTRKHHG